MTKILLENESIIEQKAQKILKYLKSQIRYDRDFLPPPFVLEITGTPSSGKTTTITEMDKFFRRQGFRVWRPQEGAEVIRHIPRTTPIYNIRTGLYALSLLVDQNFGHLYDIIIFDRCIFDAYCWMIYWQERNLLTKADKTIFQSFFLSPFWTSMIHIAYFIVCDPQIAMERELKIALSKKLGETTNPETIKLLVERYKKAYDNLSKQYKQIHLIDTTDLEIGLMVETIGLQTMDLLENNIENSKKEI